MSSSENILIQLKNSASQEPTSDTDEESNTEYALSTAKSKSREDTNESDYVSNKADMEHEEDLEKYIVDTDSQHDNSFQSTEDM